MFLQVKKVPQQDSLYMIYNKVYTFLIGILNDLLFVVLLIEKKEAQVQSLMVDLPFFFVLLGHLVDGVGDQFHLLQSMDLLKMRAMMAVGTLIVVVVIGPLL